MKLVKFITRKYSLLELSFLHKSLSKKKCLLTEIYYLKIVAVNKKGLVNIYYPKKDRERIWNWTLKAFNKDHSFVNKMLNKGLRKVKNLGNLPSGLLGGIANLSNKEIIDELRKLDKKFYEFGEFLDFTHYLGSLKIDLESSVIKKLSEFHDDRKIVFMNFFEFLNKLIIQIAKKKGIDSIYLNYLTLPELISFLKGSFTKYEICKKFKKRKIHYILITTGNGHRVITDNFNQALSSIKKCIINEKFSSKNKEVTGNGINKGKICGVVKIINPRTPLESIPSGKIIVAQMTNPAMTPILKMSKAIITDEGGLLCHSAIVAREFGIKAIIGTKIATQVFKDGDLVEVDANNGIVRKL